MHFFDTLLLQSKETMKDIITHIPLNDIALALKFEEQDVKDYFIENMNEEQKNILFALLSEIDEATPCDGKKAQEFIMDYLDGKGDSRYLISDT